MYVISWELGCKCFGMLVQFYHRNFKFQCFTSNSYSYCQLSSKNGAAENNSSATPTRSSPRYRCWEWWLRSKVGHINYPLAIVVDWKPCPPSANPRVDWPPSSCIYPYSYSLRQFFLSLQLTLRSVILLRFWLITAICSSKNLNK